MFVWNVPGVTKNTVGGRNGTPVRAVGPWPVEYALDVNPRSAANIGTMTVRQGSRRSPQKKRGWSQSNSALRTWTRFEPLWRAMPERTVHGKPPRGFGAEDLDRALTRRIRICCTTRASMAQCSCQVPARRRTLVTTGTPDCRGRPACLSCSRAHGPRRGETQAALELRSSGQGSSVSRGKHLLRPPLKLSGGSVRLTFFANHMRGSAVQSASELRRLVTTGTRGSTRLEGPPRGTLGQGRCPRRPNLVVRRPIRHGARGDRQVTEGPPLGAPRSGVTREHLLRSHHRHRSGTERKAATKVAKDRPGQKAGLVAQGDRGVDPEGQVEARADPEAGRTGTPTMDSKGLTL